MTCVVALDVGGTSMKGAVVDESYTILTTERRPTGRRHDPAAVVDFAAHLVGRASRPVAAVGVAVPGIVDDATGTAVYSVNLGWRDVPMRRLLADRLNLPIVVGHDVRTGGVAEAMLGAGRGVGDFLFLPIGTGVSAALMLDGHPYPGPTGAVGELGHIVVRPGGLPCACGQAGCVEAYASAAAIARRYNAQLAPVPTTPQSHAPAAPSSDSQRIPATQPPPLDPAIQRPKSTTPDATPAADATTRTDEDPEAATLRVDEDGEAANDGTTPAVHLASQETAITRTESTPSAAAESAAWAATAGTDANPGAAGGGSTPAAHTASQKTATTPAKRAATEPTAAATSTTADLPVRASAHAAVTAPAEEVIRPAVTAEADKEAGPRSESAVAAVPEMGAVPEAAAVPEVGGVPAEEVVRRALAGEPAAALVWDEALDALADGLHAATMVIDPSLVVVGGGLAESGDLLLGPLAERLAARFTFRTAPRLVLAELGDRAAVLGAAVLAWQAAGR